MACLAQKDFSYVPFHVIEWGAGRTRTLIGKADSRLYGMKTQRAPGFRDTLPFAWGN